MNDHGIDDREARKRLIRGLRYGVIFAVVFFWAPIAVLIWLAGRA